MWQGLIQPCCMLSRGASCFPHQTWLCCPELLPGEGQQHSTAPLPSPGSLLRLVTCCNGPITLGLAPALEALLFFILALSCCKDSSAVP